MRLRDHAVRSFRTLDRTVGEARADHPERDVRGVIVYGGDEPSERHGIRVLPRREIGEIAAA